MERSGGILPDYFLGLFIISQAQIGSVPQMPGASPFRESDLTNEFWFEPFDLLHLVCRNSFTPAPSFTGE